MTASMGALDSSYRAADYVIKDDVVIKQPVSMWTGAWMGASLHV